MKFLGLCMSAALFAVVSVVFASAPAYASSGVTVDCGDGSPMTGSVDAATLSELQSAVQAMVANPSGTSCSLNLLGALDPLASGGDPGSFVVGGGRYFVGGGTSCVLNFAINGHVDKDGTAHGTQTITESNSTTECGGQGHVKATVTCVAISGNIAEVRGDITQQTGSLGPEFFPPGDTVLVTDVVDNGKPNSGVPDRIEQHVDATGTENNCLANNAYPIFTVDNGNVSVHAG